MTNADNSMISLRTININEFNPWKDYTPPAYLPPPPPKRLTNAYLLSPPLPTHRPRQKAYVIPHRQKPPPSHRVKDTKFSIAPLLTPLEFMRSRCQLKHHEAERNHIPKEAAAFACRRCPEEFSSNTKLHEHVRTKHKKPVKPSAPASPLTPPASPVATPSAPATPPTTPKISISWAEVASRPKKPNTPSRLPRPTFQFGLPTPPPSPVLLPQEPTNHIAKRPSNTPPFAPPKKSYLTIGDLYARFHGKPRPMSLTTMQNRLQPAPSSGQMPHRQMRITAYFKPAILSKAPLASNRKHAEIKNHGQSNRNRDLAPSFSPAIASHVTHHTCRRCEQHYISGNMLHRHLRHCSPCTMRWPHARNPIGGRHPSLYQ